MCILKKKPSTYNPSCYCFWYLTLIFHSHFSPVISSVFDVLCTHNIYMYILWSISVSSLLINGCRLLFLCLSIFAEQNFPHWETNKKKSSQHQTLKRKKTTAHSGRHIKSVQVSQTIMLIWLPLLSGSSSSTGQMEVLFFFSTAVGHLWDWCSYSTCHANVSDQCNTMDFSGLQ